MTDKDLYFDTYSLGWDESDNSRASFGKNRTGTAWSD